MNKSELLDKMNSLGYPLFESSTNEDINKVLAEVVKSEELRYWEGFPVMLANSMKTGAFDYMEVFKLLNDSVSRNVFNSLFLMSLEIFRINKLDFSDSDNRFNVPANLRKNITKVYNEKVEHNETITIGSKNISTIHVLNTFKNYFYDLYSSTDDYLKIKDDHDYEFAMSQIFAKKQKIVFLKKLNNEKLSKTEREYYSRVIKKKVSAIANRKLHEMAARVLKT